MTLHAPLPHAGTTSHHWMRDILIVGIVAVLTVGVVWALSSLRPFTTSVSTTEAQQLIEFRAAERAELAAAATTAQQAIANYRSAERDDWAASSTTEQQALITYRASERGDTFVVRVPAVNHHAGNSVPTELVAR